MKKRLVWLSAVCLLASTAAARDLEDILKDKKVIDAVEANEAKAAKEKEQAATEKVLASIPPLARVGEDGDPLRGRADSQRVLLPRRHRRPHPPALPAPLRGEGEADGRDGVRLQARQRQPPTTRSPTTRPSRDDFTFKDINIANAYVKLTPSKSIGLDRPWLTVMGGKFDQPMYVPPSPNMLVWDKDLTPEGFFESLKVVDQKDGVLRGTRPQPGAVDLPGEQQHRARRRSTASKAWAT